MQLLCDSRHLSTVGCTSANFWLVSPPRVLSAFSKRTSSLLPDCINHRQINQLHLPNARHWSWKVYDHLHRQQFKAYWIYADSSSSSGIYLQTASLLDINVLEDSNRLLCAAACFSTSLLHWLSTLARFCVFRPFHVVYVFAPWSSTNYYKAKHFGVFVFNINIPTTWPDCELPTNCVWQFCNLDSVVYFTRPVTLKLNNLQIQLNASTILWRLINHLKYVIYSYLAVNLNFMLISRNSICLCSHSSLLSSIALNLVFSPKLKVFNLL